MAELTGDLPPPPIRGRVAVRPPRARMQLRSHRRLTMVLVPLAILLVAAGVALTGTLLPAIAAVFALAVLAMLLRPEAATHLFLFGLYINLPIIAIRYYGVPHLVAAGFIGVLSIPIAAYLIRGRPFLAPPAFMPMLVYLVALLVSSLLSINLEGSLGFTGIFVTEGVLLVLLVTNAIRTRETLRHGIAALLLAGAVMGGISIIQEATGSYDNDFGGFSPVNERGFAVEETIIGRDVRPRLTGPVGEQNRFAQILVVLLPLAVYQARTATSRKGSLLAAAAGVLILGGVVLTFSRMGLVTIAGLVFLMALWGEIRWRHVGAGALVVAVAAVVAFPDLIVRLDSLAPVIQTLTGGGVDETDSAVLGRLSSNVGAWRTFVDFPIFGVGPSVYASDYSGTYMLGSGFRDYSASETRQAHNLYLHILADTGLVGFVAFFAVIAVTISLLLTARRRLMAVGSADAGLATGLLLALAAYLATGVFLHMGFERYFWLLIALANAAIMIFGSYGQRAAVGVPPGGVVLRGARPVN